MFAKLLDLKNSQLFLRYCAFCFLALLTTTLFFKLFFLIYHWTSFDELSFFEKIISLFWGLKFDLAITAILTLPSIAVLWLGIRLSPFRKTWVAGVLAAFVVLVGLHCADIMYFSDSKRHLSYEIKFGGAETISLIQTAIKQYLYLFLMMGIFLLSAGSFIYKFVSPVVKKIEIKILGLGIELFLIPLVAISVIFIRGGLADEKPLTPADAFTLGHFSQGVIALNGAFSGVYYFVHKKKNLTQAVLPDISFSEKQLHFRTLFKKQDPLITQNKHTPMSSYNIVMIVLEKWPAIFMKSYGYPLAPTPFLDVIRAQSLTSSITIAAGTRTPEGLFSLLCSFQNPLGEALVETPLMFYPYRCLPHILREKGWSAAYFVGTRKSTVGVHSLLLKTGFSDAFGLNEIPNKVHELGVWGLHDPDVFNFALDYLSHAPQPFFVGIHTNTTHQYELPQGIKPPFGPGEPSHLNLMSFSDQAIEAFIKKYQADTRFHPTIFVFIADHASGEGVTRLESFRIPFFIYAPGIVEPKLVHRATSHRDVAPTVIEILGLSSQPGFSGKSLLGEHDEPYFAEYYSGGVMGWLEKDILIEFNAHTGDFLNCFNWEKDPQLKTPLTCPFAVHKIKQALSFTHYSQDLLFSGNVLKFGLF